MRSVQAGKHPVLLALASVFFWAWAATAFKESLAMTGPWQTVFFSSAVSTLVLRVTLLIRGSSVSASDLKKGAYLGFLNPFMYYLVLLHAYNGLPAQVAMVVNYLWPVVLVLLSAPLLRQRVTPGSVAGILISFGGVAFMALAGGGSLHIPAGPLLLALLSTVIWAIYWLLNARVKGEPGPVLFSGFLFGTIYLAMAGALTGKRFSVPGPVIPWILYVGVFEMGVTYMMWNTALKNATSTAAVGSLIFITPFLALIPINLVVGESIAGATLGGLLLVITGIMTERRFRERGSKV